jgi:Fibronectin type III domain
MIPLLLVAVLVAVVGSASAQSNRKPPLRLADATMIIEVNATDGDAGLQVFLDGEPWTAMKVFDPRGRAILGVDAKGRLDRFGLTELFSESHEPEFGELPLRRFKKRFPAGIYRFAGRTVEGRKLVGKARFSHDTPAGPEIIAPAAGATVPETGLVARWSPGSQPPGVQLKGYRVIVEREDPLRVFNADLPASVTSLTIPAEYLEPGVDYKIEIQAIERSGNQTISELEFKVG